MKLKDFIEQSLLEICEGIQNAKPKTDIAIAPGQLNGVPIQEANKIKFNIMVTTEQSGGGGINILPIDISGNLSHQNVNQIEFEVPIYFNSYIVKRDPRDKK